MRGIPALPLLVLLALLASSCRAATLCVRQSTPGPMSDGTSWASAYATVQSALSAASPSDEVWVAAGTYKENLTLPSGVALYGGFLGTETSREQRDPQMNTTILDGQGKSTVVTIAATATSQTIVDGFTIRNGVGPIRGTDGQGGGIYIAGGTPVITNNLITGCATQSGRTVASEGGGIYAEQGSFPLIASNTITYNHSMFGGGICAYGGLIRDNYIGHNFAGHTYLNYGQGGGVAGFGHVAIIHNVFEANTDVDSYGGGAGLVCATSPVLDNLFLNNEGENAAAMLFSGWPTVLRNTVLDAGGVDGNSEVGLAGGVFADNLVANVSNHVGLDLGMYSFGNGNGTDPLIVNNTIVDLGGNGEYGVISNYVHSEKPIFSNNILVGWDHAAAYNTPNLPPVFTTDHNDVYGNTDNALPLPGASQIGTNGNISSDPLFTDPATWDFTLKAGSPCIDAGNDVYVKSQDRDLAGAPRIAGAHVDIGAYEYGSPLYTVQDAATVLRIAAGISLSTPADTSRLDVAGETGLTVTDATRIAQWLLN